MGGASSSNDSISNSRPHSWLFPEEDDCSAGAHSQATGAGGIIGGLMEGIAGAAGGSIARPGGCRCWLTRWSSKRRNRRSC